MKKPSNKILVDTLCSRLHLEHLIPSLPWNATDAHKKIAQDVIAVCTYEVQDFIAEAFGEEVAKNFASRIVAHERMSANPDGNSRHHLTSEA